jgi:hypothetical protein
MGSRLMLRPEKRVTAPPEQKSTGGNSWSREFSTETQMRKIKTAASVAAQQEERLRFTREGLQIYLKNIWKTGLHP